jgi:hypothetical protein
MWVILLLLITTAGCADFVDRYGPNPKTSEQIAAAKDQAQIDRVSFVAFGPKFPPAQLEAIQIVTGQPAQPCTEIGLVSIRSKAGETSEQLANLLKRKAALVGADMLIKFEVSDIPVESNEKGGVSVGNPNAPQDRVLRYQEKISAVAVKTTSH